MKILAMRVNWMEAWANSPYLELLVDKMPEMDDLVYEQNGPLYFAEKEGYISFFAYSQPDRGYGGAVFPITLTDGTKVDLKGPWSSRAGVMNRAGFEPCLDVSITDDPKVWERGYTFYGAHVTKKLVDEYINEMLPDVLLLEEKPYGEDDDIVYQPVLKDGRRKPNPQGNQGKENFWKGNQDDEGNND